MQPVVRILPNGRASSSDAMLPADRSIPRQSPPRRRRPVCRSAATPPAELSLSRGIVARAHFHAKLTALTNRHNHHEHLGTPHARAHAPHIARSPTLKPAAPRSGKESETRSRARLTPHAPRSGKEAETRSRARMPQAPSSCSCAPRGPKLRARAHAPHGASRLTPHAPCSCSHAPSLTPHTRGPTLPTAPT
jgi:hypothetical protein